MKWFEKTEVYTIPGFLKGDKPIRIEGGVPKSIEVAGKVALLIGYVALTADALTASAHAATPAVAKAGNVVTPMFNEKIFPWFIDIGTPIAKTMMCIGIYKAIRGKTDEGWLTVRRAGLGLVALYLIDGGISILTEAGQSLTIKH